jgi:hypothetical protein
LFLYNRGIAFTFRQELSRLSWGQRTADLSSSMSVLLRWTMKSLRRAGLAMALTFSVVGLCFAQSIAPFDRLAGQWSGSGTIELVNGSHESIRCRAAYDVLSDQRKLQLSIRCASEGYNFELRASASYSSGAITGNWSETNRGVAGTISGRAEGDRFQVIARSPSFTATLTLLTHGGRQSVTIRSHDNQANIKSVSINLRRT